MFWLLNITILQASTIFRSISLTLSRFQFQLIHVRFKFFDLRPVLVFIAKTTATCNFFASQPWKSMQTNWFAGQRVFEKKVRVVIIFFCLDLKWIIVILLVVFTQHAIESKSDWSRLETTFTIFFLPSFFMLPREHCFDSQRFVLITVSLSAFPNWLSNLGLGVCFTAYFFYLFPKSFEFHLTSDVRQIAILRRISWPYNLSYTLSLLTLSFYPTLFALYTCFKIWKDV